VPRGLFNIYSSSIYPLLVPLYPHTPLLLSPSPSSQYPCIPAEAEFSTALSGSGGQKRISHYSDSRCVIKARRLVVVTPRHFQVHPKLSPVLWGVVKPIAITPTVLLYTSSEIPVTLKAGQKALLESNIVLKLRRLSLQSTSSERLLESSSD